MDIGDLCDLCEEYGGHDCKRCKLGNPCIDCADYDMETDTCTSKGACGDPDKEVQEENENSGE
jgi:hypothetical protein